MQMEGKFSFKNLFFLDEKIFHVDYFTSISQLNPLTTKSTANKLTGFYIMGNIGR